MNEGSKTYILRSTLDPILVEHAALTNETLLELEFGENTANEADDDDDEMLKTYGSIISWSAADQLSLLGILYVVLALILIHGRQMPDSTLLHANFTLALILTCQRSGYEADPQETSSAPERPAGPFTA